MGIALGLSSRRIIGKQRLSILVYHRVLEEFDYLRPEDVTLAEFQQQMQWVSKLFNVLPLSSAVDLMQAGKLPARAMCITFDDGYKDNLTLAKPVLATYGLPASFFVTVDYLEKSPKWDYLTEALRHTNRDEITLLGKTYPLREASQRRHFSLQAPEKIKQLPEEKADQVLSGLIADLGNTSVDGLMMNAADVRQLMNADMEIGAHGTGHHILARIDTESAQHEVQACKPVLEDMVGKPVQGFAYPNGLFPVDFTDRHIQMVEQAGYQYAVSTNTGCSHDYRQRFRLRRFTPWRRNKYGFLAELLVNYWRR